MHRIAGILAVIALTLTACSGATHTGSVALNTPTPNQIPTATDSPSPSPSPWPSAQVTHARGFPPGRFFNNRTLYGLTRRPLIVSATPSFVLSGGLSPVAVPSFDARFLAYETYVELRHVESGSSYDMQGINTGDALGIPQVHRVDLGTGKDTTIADGTTPMFSRDGALAYVRGVDSRDRANKDYLTDVVVQASPSATPVRWSSVRAKWFIAGWAGHTLLAYQDGCCEATTLYAFDSPRRQRALADNGYTDTVIAISPDGKFVILQEGTDSPIGVVVRRVSDGHIVARMSDSDYEKVRGLDYTGAWTGDRVVTAGGDGLIMLRVDPAQVVIEQLLGVSVSLQQERFLDPDTVIASSGDYSGETVCHLRARSCADYQLGGGGVLSVFNPSA